MKKKEKILKRISAAVLSLLMVVSLLPASPAALVARAEGSSGSATVTVPLDNGGTCEIQMNAESTDDTYKATLTIPSHEEASGMFLDVKTEGRKITVKGEGSGIPGFGDGNIDEEYDMPSLTSLNIDKDMLENNYQIVRPSLCVATLFADSENLSKHIWKTPTEKVIVNVYENKKVDGFSFGTEDGDIVSSIENVEFNVSKTTSEPTTTFTVESVTSQETYQAFKALVKKYTSKNSGSGSLNPASAQAADSNTLKISIPKDTGRSLMNYMGKVDADALVVIKNLGGKAEVIAEKLNKINSEGIKSGDNLVTFTHMLGLANYFGSEVTVDVYLEADTTAPTANAPVVTGDGTEKATVSVDGIADEGLGLNTTATCTYTVGGEEKTATAQIANGAVSFEFTEQGTYSNVKITIKDIAGNELVLNADGFTVRSGETPVEPTATVTGSDTPKATVTVNGAEAGATVTYSYKLDGAEKTGEATVSSDGKAEITFEEAGSYTEFKLVVGGKALTVDDFTVKEETVTEEPKAEVTGDGEEKVTVTITGTANETVKYTVTKPDGTEETKTVTLDAEGKAVLTFEEAGDYKIQLVDEDGNAIGEAKSFSVKEEVKPDTTAPTVESSKVSGTGSPKVTVTVSGIKDETALDTVAEYSYKLNGTVKAGTAAITNGTITLTFGTEGTYTDFVITVKDKAGNKTLVNISNFTVKAGTTPSTSDSGSGSSGSGKKHSSSEPNYTYTGMVLKDEASGILASGISVKSTAVLKITEIPKTSFTSAAVKSSSIYKGYDVSMDGSFYETLKVHFPIGQAKNGQTATIYHEKADGSVQAYTVTIADGYATIDVTELGRFAISFGGSVLPVTSLGVITSPKTGDVNYYDEDASAVEAAADTQDDAETEETPGVVGTVMIGAESGPNFVLYGLILAALLIAVSMIYVSVMKRSKED